MHLVNLSQFAKRLTRIFKSKHVQTSAHNHCFDTLEPRLLMSATAVISEFMAINESIITDEDGEYSDWIELHNPGSDPLNLEGWSLTDDATDLTKWELPDIDLAGGDYLLIFASDKDRTVPGAELHTNFKLSGDGEYLALVMPDGTTLTTEFAPFPQQFPDVAYGLGATAQTTTVLNSADGNTMHIPIDDSLGLTWTENGFDDSLWESGNGFVGFDLDSDYGPLIGHDVETLMHGQNATGYIRNEFTIENADDVDTLVLNAQYDDGFIAYLNGEEVASRNARSTAISPATGLLAYYDFDNNINDNADLYENNSGVSVDDFSALTTSGIATPSYQAGVVGQAVNINRLPNEAAVLFANDSNDLDLAASWTIEAFVKPDSSNTGQWDRFLTK